MSKRLCPKKHPWNTFYCEGELGHEGNHSAVLGRKQWTDGGDVIDSSEGRKYDTGKLRWALLMPWKALSYVMEVLEHGAQKYAPDNWKHVPDAQQRYTDAAMRHSIAIAQGEWLDPESGKPHAAHAICCFLFLMALKEQK